MKRFALYLYSIIKNIGFLISLILDAIGIVIAYNKDIDIPQWVFYLIFIIGFIISNYKIYNVNAPYVNMTSSLLRENPIKIKSACVCDKYYCSLMVNYNLYINNNSNNVGIIENIEISLLGFCNIKDEYILSKIGVSFDEYFISQKEIVGPFEFLKHDHETKFPIIVEPKQTSKSILILYITIKEKTRQDYINTLEWIDDFQFEVIATVKNDSVQRKIKHKISIPQKQIYEFIKEKERKKERENDADMEEDFW